MNKHLPTMVKIHVGRVLETASNPFWVSGLFLKAHNCGSQKTSKDTQFSNHSFQLFEISPIIAP
jgi:hypothetical protein